MRIITKLAIITALLVPTVASAESDEAQLHFERALEHFQAERYRAAADAFWRAYNIEPRNDILFGLAQAKRLDGKCKSAVRYYKKLLRRDLPEADRAAVVDGMEQCGVKNVSRSSTDEDGADEKIAARKRQQEEEARAQEATQGDEDESEDEDEDDEDAEATSAASSGSNDDRAASDASSGSPWYTDAIGDALLVSGVIGLGVGTGFFLVSSSDRDAAQSASNYETHQTLLDRAQSRRNVAIVATSLSVAAITGAIVRFATRDDGSQSESATAFAWGSSQDVGLAVGGHF